MSRDPRPGPVVGTRIAGDDPGAVERPGHHLREHRPEGPAVHDAVVGGDRVAQGVHEAEPATGERLPGEVRADEHLGPRGRVAAVAHRDRQPGPHPAQRLRRGLRLLVAERRRALVKMTRTTSKTSPRTRTRTLA